MADVGTHRTAPAVYSKESYISTLLSRLYQRYIFLALLIKRGGGDGDLRPNALNLVGGGNLSYARREELGAPAHTTNIHFQTGKSTGTKNMSVRDTVPQVTTPTTDSQDQQRKSAFVRWSKKMTEVIVWNTSVDLGMGSNAVGNAKVDAANIGMQHHLDHFAEEVWVGEPADQTADLWSEQQGVDVVCDDDNTYCGIDRSQAAGAGWRSFRSATAYSPSLSLIPRLHVQLQGSYTDSVMDITEGFNTVIAARNAYLSLRAEAEAGKGGIRIIGEGNEELAKLGVKRECIVYGNTVITYDPWLKNYNTGSSSGEPDLSTSMLFTDIKEWIFRTHPRGSFDVGEWVSIGKYTEGGKDAMRTLITTYYQWWCDRSWSSFLLTNVA